ncbi:MAG: DUF362 domain-containing protein [Acidobacteriota bacterium]
MNGVYEEFEQELELWRVKYASAPRREILKLFLLALEREEIVSIGYREEAILKRLRQMPITEDARDLVHHALLWSWKDEQMHAIYMRGAILKYGSPRLRLLAFASQMAGVIGGWATSVRQHVRWSQAPLSRLWATWITWLGFFAGKIPGQVRRHLDYRSFREFCLFNIDAERTAWLCFKRLVEILEKQNEFDTKVIDDFRRTMEDEDRHKRIFEILAAAFDENDELVNSETADTLAQKIAEVGEIFLPRAHRKNFIARSPLGSGGAVCVLQGTTAEEKIPLFHHLLGEAKLKQALEDRATQLGKTINQLRVTIKPNFMLGYSQKDQSVITDPALIEQLALYLRSLGCRDITVIEARNLYDFFYQNRSVETVARYFNITSNNFKLVDASAEQIAHDYPRGLGQRTVSHTWKESDFRISFAKLCSHPVDIVFLTLNNVETLGEPCDKFIFVERQAHKDTAVMMLLDQFPPHFALIDAYDTAADGLLGMISCPRPKRPWRFYAGHDALAVDMVASRHMGIKEVRNVGLMQTSRHWFGDPSKRIEVVGSDEPLADWRSPYHNEWTTMLSMLAFPVYEFGSGRGASFVPEMDETAFPQIGRESLFLKLRRRSLQRFLGIRHPKSLER